MFSGRNTWLKYVNPIVIESCSKPKIFFQSFNFPVALWLHSHLSLCLPYLCRFLLMLSFFVSLVNSAFLNCIYDASLFQLVYFLDCFGLKHACVGN